MRRFGELSARKVRATIAPFVRDSEDDCNTTKDTMGLSRPYPSGNPGNGCLEVATRTHVGSERRKATGRTKDFRHGTEFHVHRAEWPKNQSCGPQGQSLGGSVFLYQLHGYLP